MEILPYNFLNSFWFTTYFIEILKITSFIPRESEESIQLIRKIDILQFSSMQNSEFD